MQISAIVTGHSRGLGAAVAENFLGRGIATLGLSRHVHADLGQRFPTLLQEVTLDLSDPSALGAWLAGPALANWGLGHKQIVLVNNAGTVEPIGALPMQDAMAVAKAVALNVAAPLMLSSAFVAATNPKQDRRILHVSSGAARNAYAGWSVYGATKAALDQHARTVVAEDTAGVRICSLAPGVIDTEMQATIRATSLDAFPMRARFDALKAHGGLASPHDCARRLVEYMLGESFGLQPVADLRDVAA